MQVLMREYDLSAGECASVRDGYNDIKLAEEVGTSIAFNADPRLEEASTYVVKHKEEKEDFRDILKYFP